jgi:hypothetical protein
MMIEWQKLNKKHSYTLNRNQTNEKACILDVFKFSPRLHNMTETTASKKI